MKLSLEDVKPVAESDPLVLFHQGNKSPETDKMYTHMLKRVLCVICEDMLSGTFEERAAEFVRHSRENPVWCRDVMLGMSRLLRERTELPAGDPDRMNPSTITTYFAPVKKLLDMNDITISWKRVYMTFPEKQMPQDSRGWTREEISRLLAVAGSAKYRAVILLLASSGIRKGGLRLFWKDFTPIYRDGDALSESGDGRIFFTFANVTDYNFGSTYAAYFNVTGHVYAFVTDFAGDKILPMEAELYTYPDAAFHHAITLKSIDGEGNIRPAPLMIKSVVREDLGAIPLSDYIHEKILYDTDDIGFADLAVHDTYPMELDIETGSGLIDTKIRRTASWFPKFTHDAHVGPEGPGAPLKLDPSDLVVPIVDGLNSFSEFGKVQSDSEIVSGIVGFFGFITQTTTFGDVFDENMTDVGSIANRTDLSELMKLVNATQELGYGGPEEVSIASYYAYPDTSRLNMPLNTGFEIGSSPVNVTYGNGFYSHFMDHVKPVFEGHTTLLINSALDNVLNVTRHGDVAMIWPTENFGPVLAIELNSTSFPIQSGFEGQCITGCAVPVGWGDVDIKAHNQWGGQANYHSPAQEKPPSREEEPVNYDMWFLLAGIVAMVVLIGRLIKNRLERGVWSINA